MLDWLLSQLCAELPANDSSGGTEAHHLIRYWLPVCCYCGNLLACNSPDRFYFLILFTTFFTIFAGLLFRSLRANPFRGE